ncbi:MAG TPA: DUF3089 domain-containing protein [Hyphomonadaceae bacterium]|nr:DUF3089 domain-containing protein [Hyphomonadaceae bacterium]
MRLGSTIVASLLGFGLMGAPALAQTAPDATVAHADYANSQLWLCRPDLKDNKCKVDLDATIVKTDGKTEVVKYKAATDPKIDCFFIYPTVSLDPGWQSDFAADHMEFDDVKLQFARFGADCRQFAPIYRQTTLTALRVASGGPAPSGERPAQGFGGFTDVVDAWNWYMAHENKGRGVVIIGHSQGAGLATRLIAQEIEGKPAQKQFISAIILGSAVGVPEGKDTGGSFKAIPLCHAEDQLGCVITYASFRDTNPPPPGTRFGKAGNGLIAACTNPANLATGKGTPDSYFLTKGFLNGSGGTTQPAWATPEPKISTPFVKVPGLVSTECVDRDGYSYLQMHVNADPKDARTDQLAGEVIRATGPDLTWGLHLIDVDHSMGDLVRIVGKQAAAWTRTH